MHTQPAMNASDPDWRARGWVIYLAKEQIESQRHPLAAARSLYCHTGRVTWLHNNSVPAPAPRTSLAICACYCYLCARAAWPRRRVCISANGDNDNAPGVCYNLCSLARTPLWILRCLKCVYKRGEQMRAFGLFQPGLFFFIVRCKRSWELISRAAESENFLPSRQKCDWHNE